MKMHTLSILILLTLALLTPLTKARPFTIPPAERTIAGSHNLCKRARRKDGLPSQKCLCSLVFSKQVRTQKTHLYKKLCLKFFDKKSIFAFDDPCEEYMAFPKVVDLNLLAKKINRLLKICMPDVEKLLFPQCFIFRALFKRRCLLVMG